MVWAHLRSCRCLSPNITSQLFFSNASTQNWHSTSCWSLWVLIISTDSCYSWIPGCSVSTTKSTATPTASENFHVLNAPLAGKFLHCFLVGNPGQVLLSKPIGSVHSVPAISMLDIECWEEVLGHCSKVSLSYSCSHWPYSS